MRRKRLRTLQRIVGVYLPLAAFVCFALFPFYWMLISSFKANPELYNLRANRLWIANPTLDQFRDVFAKTAILQWLWNSFFVSFLTSFISMTFGVMAGYALARLRFPGAQTFGLATFITYLVPTTLIFIPLASVVQKLGLSNSIWSLVVTYPTFLIPFCTWMLIAYFKSIPKDMEECAMIDGCSRIGAMVRIVLPMAIPGVIFSAMFSFTLSWNEFVYALTFISDTTHKTMSVAVPTELIRGDAYFWGELMAASLIGSVPVALLYSFFMDYFVSGLTAGALKG
ncbi:MAG: carbohydrate ABC transporter permease [Candidatus Methylomirabilota bacterium]|jgi:multiple sugar transport system permease protein